MITLPHPIEAKTGAVEKTSVEPRTAKRRRAASGTFGESLSLKVDNLRLGPAIYGLGVSSAVSSRAYFSADSTGPTLHSDLNT